MSSPSDWIATQSDRGLAMACHAFAQSLNCWSPGGLEALLAEDCHHESQVRFAPVEGRDALVDVFASHAGRPVRTTFYELANEPLHAEPCVLVSFRDSLYGRTGLGQVRSYVSLRLDSSGLIDRSSAISLTPDPKTCARSGIYPGINPKELQAERDYLGELLQPSDLQMYLYFDPALDWAVGSQRLIVEAVAREFGLVQPLLAELGGNEGLSWNPTAHPSIVLARGDELVRLLEGQQTADELRAVLESILSTLVRRRAAAPKPVQGTPSWTPQGSYFRPPATEVEAILRRIKGNHRRTFIRASIEEDGLESIPEAWLVHDLAPVLKDLLGRQHPGARGGEDLPDLDDGEVEIARVTLESIHCEVTSLRARSAGEGRCTLRLVDEYETEFDLGHSERSDPMSTDEVLALLRDAEPSPVDTACDFMLSSPVHVDLHERYCELYSGSSGSEHGP